MWETNLISIIVNVGLDGNRMKLDGLVEVCKGGIFTLEL